MRPGARAENKTPEMGWGGGGGQPGSRCPAGGSEKTLICRLVNHELGSTNMRVDEAIPCTFLKKTLYLRPSSSVTALRPITVLPDNPSQALSCRVTEEASHHQRAGLGSRIRQANGHLESAALLLCKTRNTQANTQDKIMDTSFISSSRTRASRSLTMPLGRRTYQTENANQNPTNAGYELPLWVPSCFSTWYRRPPRPVNEPRSSIVEYSRDQLDKA